MEVAFGMDDEATCGVCENALEIVRGGKYQCPTCDIRRDVQRKLFAAIDMAIDRDGHHKSYEGAVEVANRRGEKIFVNTYGNRWKDGEWEASEIFSPGAYTEEFANEAPAYCLLELHCYVLGGHRHYTYTAVTEIKCWEKLESDIVLWRKEMESNYEICFEDADFQYNSGSLIASGQEEEGKDLPT